MRTPLVLAGLAILFGAAVAPPLRGQTPAASVTVTNSIGMELIRVEPGTMQVGVFHPDCSNGARAGAAAAAAGRAAAPPAGAPSTASTVPGGVADGAAVAPAAAPAVPLGGARGGRGGPRDPRMNWDAADLAACEKLVAADRTDGSPVAIKGGFFIGKTEVTQGQWKAVMNTNPSMFQADRVTNPDRHPVEQVTWDDAQKFVRALNAKERTTTYRLPAELEWEYACRAGGLGQQTWTEIRALAVLGLGLAGRGGGRGAPAPGATPPPATPVTSAETVTPETLAQYTARTGMTNEVGTKTPNAWGLYDMLGNVWEWTADFHNGKMFPDAAPPRSGSQRVLKGGAFTSDVKNAICATHGFGPADGFEVGFRIVKDLP
ncbi:MAG: SUMF1/EgtB/PvdO family nonheme iron enzyme [Vicinamibacterales bacterium]